MARKSKIGDAAAQAQANRDAMAARSREQSAAVADIGELPSVLDPERREHCRLDLHEFLKTYFPYSTGLSPFSDDHIRVIGRIQRCVLEGGLFVNAIFRGGAKTTISENAAIWATLYGHRKFVPIFGAEASAAAGNIDSIKLELSANDLLYADFPEVCHAVRALEGKVQRCHSQTYKGELTHIEWRADTIVLPTIPDSAASGCIITAHGLTGASRGMKHKRADGTQQRPDFVLIDDPQTDESAGSELQVEKRLDVIRKSILKLGGHARKMAAVINATVIRPADMIERLLDAKKFPAWQGERIKMVKSWATRKLAGPNGTETTAHETLWVGDYARIRNTYSADVLGDQQRAHREATEFYKLNRDAMDEGCSVSWEHCLDPDTEISAIQHAYNAFIDDGPEVFASECQNEPLEPERQNAAKILTADEICQKLSLKPRGIVPLECTRLVAFIDVQQDVLPWAVMAFADGFSGTVLDYGHWPEQGRSYFAKRDIPRRTSIAGVTKAAGLEAQIYAALDVLVGKLAVREFTREDGTILKIERMAPDCGWGASTDVVYQFCRNSPHAAMMIPSKGFGITAKQRQLNEEKPKPGERLGLNWIIKNAVNRRAARTIQFDTNFWKSFVHARLSTERGARGCMTIFGDDRSEHRMLADHLVSEFGTEVFVESKGRRKVEWQIRPTHPDNDLLDCVVGCHVLASMQGVSMKENERVQRVVRKTVSFAESQKTRRVWGAKH